MSRLGYFALVLHSHLPYVLSHGRWPHGTDWLMEAGAESYIPLLDALHTLAAEGVPARVTVGITPILAEQLAHPAFRTEMRTYLRQKVEAAEADERAFAATGHAHRTRLARRWAEHFARLARSFSESYGEDLPGAFARLAAAGQIEILTSGATHGYFPLLSEDTSIDAQIKAGLASHRRLFGPAPRGIWLPECAYRPRYRWARPVDGGAVPRLRKGVDELVSENGLDYFVIDDHLLRGGRAIGVYAERFEALRRLWGQFAKEHPELREERDIPVTPREVYLVNSSGEPKRPVAVFTRDPETSLQVWSGEHGYPGDGWYLEFHKKHYPGGHRYWRVTSATSDLADKAEYEPDRVTERIAENADHFVALLKRILDYHRRTTGREGIVVAPYDTELFGHWWHEGVEWIAQVLRRIARDPDLETTTLGAHCDRVKPDTIISLPEGSWGEGGYHFIWMNEMTEWTWRHIYPAEEEMRRLAQRGRGQKDPALRRLLQGAARQLLLLESSDWPFLISTRSAKDYAELRFSEHLEDFRRLAALADRALRGQALSAEEWAWVAEVEERDAVFPDLDPDWFAEVEFPARE